MGIETKLNDVIMNDLSELNRMEVGSEEYKNAVDGITKLVDRTIEMKRLNIEADDKHEGRRIDTELKIGQMNDDRKDRLIGHILTAVGIAIPSIITVWGTIKSIEFEKEGTITTIMGRGFIQKLLPKK